MTSLKNKLGDRLQPESFEVVVIKDPNLRPFLNVFQIDGTNIQQQKLGKIFGIIQIDDNSENSAYLPNLLTQILKKEYYKNKNKSCGKSFEIALHKLNLTLTELAQHEIVKWINNLNAVIGVICEKEIHFTQIGRGRLIILKDKKATIIGDETTVKDSDYHPMKTFATISAGKIKLGDKLIFTIQETLKTLNKDELERHYKTFNSDEFDNIITSTLRNEASNTGIVVVNAIRQEDQTIKETPEMNTLEKTEEDLNFFGKKEEKKQKIKPDSRKNKTTHEIPEKKVLIKDPKKSPFENEPEIFLKENDDEEWLNKEKEQTKKIDLKRLYKNSVQNCKNLIKNCKKSPSIKKISFNKVHIEKISSKVSNQINQKKLKEISKQLTISVKNQAKKYWSKIDFKKIYSSFLSFVKKISGKSIEIIKNIPNPKKLLLKILGNFEFRKLINKIGIEVRVKQDKSNSKNGGMKKIFTRKNHSSEKIDIKEKKSSPSPSISSEKIDPDDFFSPKRQPQKIEKGRNYFKDFMKKGKENYPKIKNILKDFWINPKSKKVFLTILLVIIILSALFTISKIINSNSQNSEIITNNNSENQKESSHETVDFKNLASINKPIKDSVFFRNDLFLLTEDNALIQFSIRDNKKTEIKLPTEFKNATFLSTIESLQLILLTSPNQVYSYSPVTGKFSENKINIPFNSEIIGTGTYLTYFYLLDKKSNQIYRYHRAPGGFGEYKAWLKEDVNIENATNLDISDSIYISHKNNLITKYFENKKVADFSLEDGFVVDKIKTKIDSNELFALDKEKGKIIELSENGEFKKSFQNKNFKNTVTFSVNFENKKVYLITENLELVVFNY